MKKSWISLGVVGVAISFFVCIDLLSKPKITIQKKAQLGLLTQSESSVVFPESHTEIFTDTILSSGFTTRVKNFSKEGRAHVLRSNPKHDKFGRARYLRRFESSIQVCWDNQEIFKKDISDLNFVPKAEDSFWYNATIQHSWLNQEASTTDSVVFNLIFTNPLNDASKFYELEVDKSGKFRIKLIEEYYS